MTKYEDALEIVLSSVAPLAEESVPLARSAGAVLARDVTSDVDLPPFDRAAMDGYAVRAADVQSAGATLRVVAIVEAGHRDDVTFGDGECVRIFTGAPVPACADTVIQQELTERGEGDERVRFTSSLSEGANIALRGEDVRSGARVLEAGHRMCAPEIALAAASGAKDLTVRRRPTVAILSTGSELVAHREAVGPGATRDANGPALMALFSACGYESTFLGIARDDLSEISGRLAEGVAGADVLIVTAGVSVGDRDLVPEAVASLGFEARLSSIAMKPGKPTKLWVRENQAIFGVPGNPVSALVVSEMVCLPALRRMAGITDCVPRAATCVLTGEIRKKPGRRLFAPGRKSGSVDAHGRPLVEPVTTHGSADLVAHSKADVLISIPAASDGAHARDEVEFYDRGH